MCTDHVQSTEKLRKPVNVYYTRSFIYSLKNKACNGFDIGSIWYFNGNQKKKNRIIDCTNKIKYMEKNCCLFFFSLFYFVK